MQFYGTVFEKTARKFIAEHHWRIRHIQPEFADALQECALEFTQLCKITGDAIDDPRWFMAAFLRHLQWAFTDMARKNRRYVATLAAARDRQLTSAAEESELHDTNLVGASRELRLVLEAIAMAPRDLLDLMLPAPQYRFSADAERRISRSWCRLARVGTVNETLFAELKGLLA